MNWNVFRNSCSKIYVCLDCGHALDFERTRELLAGRSEDVAFVFPCPGCEAGIIQPVVVMTREAGEAAFRAVKLFSGARREASAREALEAIVDATGEAAIASRDDVSVPVEHLATLVGQYSRNANALREAVGNWRREIKNREFLLRSIAVFLSSDSWTYIRDIKIPFEHAAEATRNLRILEEAFSGIPVALTDEEIERAKRWADERKAESNGG